MITMDELEDAIELTDVPQNKNEVSLRISGVDDPDEIIEGLMEYFGESGVRKKLRVRSATGKSGYFTRPGIYQFVGFANRGIGSGDHSTVPGSHRYKLTKLCCSVDGCTHSYLVAGYDKNNPPLCDDHDNSKMRPCP